MKWELDINKWDNWITYWMEAYHQENSPVAIAGMMGQPSQNDLIAFYCGESMEMRCACGPRKATYRRFSFKGKSLKTKATSLERDVHPYRLPAVQGTPFSSLLVLKKNTGM